MAVKIKSYRLGPLRESRKQSLSDVEGIIRTMLARGLSHRAIVYTLGTVRQVLAYGITEGAVSVNVAASVKAPRKAHSDARPVAVWEPIELEQFRQVADADEWAAAWRLTLCGLRRSEVLGLSWGAVDLERGEVQVQAGRVLLDGHRTAVDDPKSSASRRTVAVGQTRPGTVALLRSLKARQTADRLALGPGYPETGLVLVDPLGQPVRPEHYSDRFRVLARQAGVPVVRLHSVRHTLGLIMHRAGVAPVDAAAFLGHSLEVHYATYLPSSERGARSAAAALGVALAGSV